MQSPNAKLRAQMQLRQIAMNDNIMYVGGEQCGNNEVD